MSTSAVILADQLRALDVRCPKCGAPPRLRVAYRGDPFEDRVEDRDVILTYQCHGRKCDTVYPITVEAFLHAK